MNSRTVYPLVTVTVDGGGDAIAQFTGVPEHDIAHAVDLAAEIIACEVSRTPPEDDAPRSLVGAIRARIAYDVGPSVAAGYVGMVKAADFVARQIGEAFGAAQKGKAA